MDIKKIFGGVNQYKRRRDWQGDEIWLPTTVGYLFYNILNYEALNKKKRIPNLILNTKNKD